MVDHIIPGRSRDARPPTEKELRSTMLLRMPLAESSAKVRTGWPLDDEEDYDLDIWAGVIPISTTIEPARVDPGSAGRRAHACLRGALSPADRRRQRSGGGGLTCAASSGSSSGTGPSSRCSARFSCR